MTYLMKFMLFLVSIKFQFIQMEFSDKEDYFNHNDNALPEFFVDESLFKTNKPPDGLKNPPWITERTTKNEPTITVNTTRKSALVTVTFDSKVYWVTIPPPNIKVIRSMKKSVTSNVLLPIWSSKSTIQATTRAPTGTIARSTTTASRTTIKSTTKPTITATSKLIISAPSRTTPRPTTTTASRANTGSTIKPITKSTTESTVTSTTRKVSTTMKPRYEYIVTTNNIFTVVPIKPKVTKPWAPLIEITKRNPEATKTATEVSPVSYYAVTYTAPPITTMKPSVTPTTTEMPTLMIFNEAKFNRLRPETLTQKQNNHYVSYTYTAPSSHSTVFLDLTLKRMGVQGENEETEAKDERNQTMNNLEAEREVTDEKKQTANKLQDKDVVEYLVLETEPFSKFLELLMKQLAFMESIHAAKFFKTFERQFAVLMNAGRFEALGPVTTAYIQDAMKSFQFPVDHKQSMLGPEAVAKTIALIAVAKHLPLTHSQSD